MHKIGIWIQDIFGIKYTVINQYLVKIGTNLIISVLIFVIGFWLANIVSRMMKKVLRRGKADEGLVSFSSSFVSMLLKLLVAVTAITQLGIEMTSFVALLGAAGLAVGMAFSGTLSNFAGGIMILVLKPFKIGDTVLVQGEQGVVKEIQIFNTHLHTPDNKVIILPNGPVANGNIVNFTKADKRRVDWEFGIAYGDDFQKAKQIINNFIADDERILKDPEPFIGLSLLADSSVNFVVRVWVKTEDYHTVFFAINERVYNEFESVGLHFPYPQMDVHLVNEEKNA